MRVPCVIVADDHSVVLAGIRSLLADFCDVIETVGDGRALIDGALRWRPDLILLDVSMPLLNGIDAARQIKKAWPEAKLLFLSMHGTPVYVREALNAGGSGYLLKSSAAEELRTAIETVLRGEMYLTAALGREILQNLLTPSGRPARASVQLTDRQRQILQLIAEGRSNKEIATLLSVSVKTIEFHRSRIMTKVGAHTVAELATFAVREGIVG